MHYPNHYQNGRDEVKVAVLADQMRTENNASLSLSDLFWGCAAAALTVSCYLALH
jgi:hypothetical protein